VMPRNTRAVDFSEVSLKESHPSLVVMLVFTQLSVGAFITHAWSTPNFGNESTPAVALLFAVVALLSSVGHLGRPQYAFRALIGLAHSWLSREILALGVFFGVASVYVLLVFIGDDSIILDTARYGVTGVGLAAVLTSAMIYIRTGRPGWASLLTAAKFLLTSVWLGVLSSLAIRVILQNPQGTTLLLSITMVAAAFKLAIELSALVALSSSVESPFRQRASALVGPLRTLWLTRLGFGFWGGLIGPFLFFEHLPVWGALSIWLLAVGGELIERHLFFVSSVAPRMPGDLA
ncbi:MAG: DmsC/YnfH family molybdoenzyme membrane anchor subunit, partial [Myxococcota bacterium]